MATAVRDTTFNPVGCDSLTLASAWVWMDDLRVVRFGGRRCTVFRGPDGAGPSNATELAPGFFTPGSGRVLFYLTFERLGVP